MGITDLPDLSKLRLRPLAGTDGPVGERLAAEAGWNQNAADWAYLLANGLGWGYEDETAQLGATAMILPYGGAVAWIGMVLVTAPWRKRGIATALLRHCLRDAEERGWVPGLDATEAGRKVYLPLGFSGIYPLTRFMAEPATPAGNRDDVGCRPMIEADLATVTALDESTFGAQRRDLLAHLLGRAPRCAWVAEWGGDIVGFCLGRDGREADQIGPVIAADAAAAAALCTRALAARAEPDRRVYIDAVDRHAGFAAWLRAAGFVKQRGFMRMLKGRNEPIGDPAPTFAIAGPELG
ncbi:MAG: GNAT family N-acetyltransferase [Alphaproteobacteria bacterium]